jgi:hypothetical protein
MSGANLVPGTEERIAEVDLIETAEMGCQERAWHQQA